MKGEINLHQCVFSTPPPPLGNSIKREENMKYLKKKYLQSFEKIYQCVFELQCEN